MPARVIIDWRGDQVIDHLIDSVKAGLFDTAADCVFTAKDNAPVLTGTYQGSIMAMDPDGEGLRLFVLWGSFDVNYALWIEVGSSSRPGRYVLRHAGDLNYPRLAENISKRYKGQVV